MASWVEKHVDNPTWSKLLAEAQIGHAPRTVTYERLVFSALRANRLAETVRFGADPLLERQQKRRQDLLGLANHADPLVAYFEQQEDPEFVSWCEGLFGPLPRLTALHRKQARFFRSRAGVEPKSTAPPTRQDRRGKHVGLRKRRAFIALMSDELEGVMRLNRYSYGHNDHINAVAAFARIEFPEVAAEVVRKTLEPTTREGRQQKRAAAAQERAAESQKHQARQPEETKGGFPPLVDGADPDLPIDL